MNNGENGAGQPVAEEEPPLPVITAEVTKKSTPAAAKETWRRSQTRGMDGDRPAAAQPSSEQTPLDDVDARPTNVTAAVRDGVARMAADRAEAHARAAERIDVADVKDAPRAEAAAAAGNEDASAQTQPPYVDPDGKPWTYGKDQKRR